MFRFCYFSAVVSTTAMVVTFLSCTAALQGSDCSTFDGFLIEKNVSSQKF